MAEQIQHTSIYKLEAAQVLAVHVVKSNYAWTYTRDVKEAALQLFAGPWSVAVGQPGSLWFIVFPSHNPPQGGRAKSTHVCSLGGIRKAKKFSPSV